MSTETQFERRERVIRMRDDAEMSFAETGRELGVTGQRAKELYLRGKTAQRHPDSMTANGRDRWQQSKDTPAPNRP